MSGFVGICEEAKTAFSESASSHELARSHVLSKALVLTETIQLLAEALQSDKTNTPKSTDPTFLSSAWSHKDTGTEIVSQLGPILTNLHPSLRLPAAVQLDKILVRCTGDGEVDIATLVLDLAQPESRTTDEAALPATHRLLTETDWQSRFRLCHSPARAGKLLRLWGDATALKARRAGWTAQTIVEVSQWMGIVHARLDEYNVRLLYSPSFSSPPLPCSHTPPPLKLH